jgi:hypothetical protein
LANPSTQLPDQRKSVSDHDLDHASGLYRHKKRPEWGAAILAWDKDDRRAYQFEDGRLRKFKKGYYSLMQPVEELERSRETVVSSLEHAIRSHTGEKQPEPLEPVAKFKDQIKLFIEMYPKGFADPKWIADHRGTTESRTLKRHREPAVREAKEALAEDRVATLLTEGAFGEIVEAVTEILAGTSLVTLKYVKTLKGLDPDENERLARSFADLLHGEGDYDPRFREHLTVLTEILGTRPSWRLATALPALVFPQEQVCVRRSAFMRQAASVAPRAKYSRRAHSGAYRNFRRVAFAARKRLQAAGQEPRDLLDIHDFIWATLRNAALERLG